MTEPKWLDLRMVTTIHAEAIELFGGAPGIRDNGLLESALSRPQNRYAYQSDASLFELAASLCHGLAKNHPFFDGNKRTALLAARAFLFLNGKVFEPREVDEVETMVGVATGAVDEAALAVWFRANSAPRPTTKPRKR